MARRVLLVLDFPTIQKRFVKQAKLPFEPCLGMTINTHLWMGDPHAATVVKIHVDTRRFFSHPPALLLRFNDEITTFETDEKKELYFANAAEENRGWRAAGGDHRIPSLWH